MDARMHPRHQHEDAIAGTPRPRNGPVARCLWTRATFRAGPCGLALAIAVTACGGGAASPASTPDAGPALDDTLRPDADVVIVDAGADAGGEPSDAAGLGDPVTFLGRPTPEDYVQEAVEVGPVGDRVATCGGLGAFAMYDVETTSRIRLVRRTFPEIDRTGRNRCQHFAPVDRFVVVAHHGDETLPQPFLATIDPNDGDTVAVHSPPDAPAFEGVASYGRVLYVAAHEAGLLIFQVGSDGTLTPHGTVGDLQNAWKPVVDPEHERLFVADAQGGVVAYDIRDPIAPRFTGRVTTQGTTKDLAVGRRYVYAASGTAGVEVIDTGAPGAMEKIGRVDTPGSALGIALEGPRLVVADWGPTFVFDISAPAQPALMGHQKAHDLTGAPNAAGRILDVFVREGRLFAAEWNGLEVHQLIIDADAPDLLAPRQLTFPRTPVGGEEALGMTLRNVGRRPLQVHRIITPSSLSVEPTQFSLDPGRQRLVTITFRPVDLRAIRATVTIISDDPDEAEMVVPVSANEPGLHAGDEVPDLEMLTLDGQTLRLSELRGQPVLLAYFATF